MQKVCGAAKQKFPAFHGSSLENMCSTVCVMWVKGGLLISVLRVRLRKNVSVNPLRFRWTEQTSVSVEVHLGVQPPPLSGLNPCALAFLLPLFTVVASVSRLPSPRFSEWYGLVSADRFCIIPNHLQIVLSAVEVFFWEQAAPAWIQLDCVARRLRLDRKTCVVEPGSVLDESSVMIQLHFSPPCQWCVLFSGEKSVGARQLNFVSSNPHTK